MKVKKEQPSNSSVQKKGTKKAKSGSKLSDSEKVELYMAELKHPLKAEVEAVRKIIKRVSKKISERIKWNAPSYYTTEDMVTFNLWNKDQVHLVFHHPFIVKIKSSLLEGDYKTRRMVYFNNMKEVKAGKKELERILNKLVNGIER